jgi:iron complex transport system permease protein
MPSDAGITQEPGTGLFHGIGAKIPSLRSRQTLLVSLGLMLLLFAFAAISNGSYSISFGATLAILFDTLIPFDLMEGSYASHEANILRSIRLPRVLAAIVVGGALGLSGAVLQSIFRNPLAEPGLIGVSSGSALAAVAVIILFGGELILMGANIAPYILPAAAFAGGVTATAIVYAVGRKAKAEMATTMLLIGIAVNAIAMAGIGIFQFLSDDTQLRLLTFWMLGGLGSVTWQTLLPVALIVVCGSILLMRLAVPLNAYLMGSSEAMHLGVNVAKMTGLAVLLSALIVGASVSISGIISFVGLIVPHLVRQVAGADNRKVIPASMLMGASLLSIADLISRLLIAPAELPIGLVTSAIGGPFFLWLLLNRGRQRP